MGVESSHREKLPDEMIFFVGESSHREIYPNEMTASDNYVISQKTIPPKKMTTYRCLFVCRVQRGRRNVKSNLKRLLLGVLVYANSKFTKNSLSGFDENRLTMKYGFS